jgi:hypothetical protein
MSLKIGYYSECNVEYVSAVKKCRTLEELQKIVSDYREIAEDAYQSVQKMDDLLFEQFCKGRNKTKPSMRWMEMYGPVLLPRIIIEVGLVAAQFCVPFGTAYIRMKELGKLGSVHE